MKSGFAIAFVLAASLSVRMDSSAEPVTDCAKAELPVERLICQSEHLQRQDVTVSRLYDRAIAQLSGRAQAALRKAQEEWLQGRDRVCDPNADDSEICLHRLYQSQIEQFAALVAFDSSDRPAAGTLGILRVTPEGDDVLASRQVVLQFDRPVVPIGRMERESKDIPVSIRPALNCEWRWLNTSALACQLRDDNAMKQATHYDIEISPGIETEDGLGLAGTHRRAFTTARPKVTYTRFLNWLSPGTPLIQVTFNQSVTKPSVESALSIATPQGTVGIYAHADNLPRRPPLWMLSVEEHTQPMVDDRPALVAGAEARRVWVIEPRRELPLDMNVALTVKPGLQSSEGPERGVETRTIVTFDTYPEFEFVGIRCTPKGAREPQNILLENLPPASGIASPGHKCAPLQRIALLFTAPVLNSSLKQHVAFEPALNGGREDYDPWQNAQDWTQLGSPHRKHHFYQHWLPEYLQAHQRYSVHLDDENLTDEFGRRLGRAIDFDFHTSHREPNLKLGHHAAVLEKGVNTDVPLYVTNLDHVDIRYDKLGDSTQAAGLRETLSVNDVEDIAYALPMNVKRLLGDDSGVLFARLRPHPVPPRWYHDPEIMVQVTPYQIHYKLGHFNSLAWVTDFANGEPVAAAKVSLFTGTIDALTGLQALNKTATTDQNGLAELPGLSEIDPELELIYGHNGTRLFAKVEKDDDIAILPVDYGFAVRGNGVYPRLRRRGGHTHAWGTTAQGIYKLGDTIEFKIYVREQSNRHWVAPENKTYVLQLNDPQGRTVFEKTDVVLNEFGALDGKFRVPEQSAVGWYRFQLSPAKQPGEKRPRFTWTPLSVLVSDFTPAPFKVKTELNGELFNANDQVAISSLATLHAGGPFTDAEIRVTARLSAKPFQTDNPLAAGFVFGSFSGTDLNRTQSNLLDVRGRLNDQGQYENAFVLPETDIYYGSLMVESAVKDDRGKFVAATSTADYTGRNRFVGLKHTRWLYRKGAPESIEALVVDRAGDVVADAPVSVVISRREYKAARVKGPGNAFLTQNVMQWSEESNCEITTATAPLPCEFTPQHPGYYQFVASTTDELGRAHNTALHGWVTGSGSVVWDQSNDATLQIVAERTDHQVGDVARYLVKNPFPGAKALISIERYGVLDSWVKTLDSSTPVIEVPIKPDYLPGFYLSVVAVSPRVEKPLGPGKVDLGKPSYRMGYVSAAVSDPYKQLAVDIQTERKTYKPREKVRASIHVEPRAGENAAPIEIAVAVVDESVLAMNVSGRAYYDPYAGFNRLDSLDVNNYSLISRLLGRQKFEKKGANPGGGGGAASAQLRNLFKFVSYWNPSIVPDAAGNASVEFEVPDNLTGWRILALAVTPNDRMGLGDANIKVNRPTEIRPVMPNQLTEGDIFKAGFSVMNRTDASRDLNVSITVDGPLADGTEPTVSYEFSIAPYKRKQLWLPLATKGYGDLKFVAEGGDAMDADAVEHGLVVNKRHSLETAATYGTTTKALIRESVKVPEGIFTDVGEISAVLSPTVIGNIEGAFNYVRDYPHRCWEQRLTKAVVAASFIELQAYVDRSVAWPNPDTDIANALDAAPNFQAPNGGMVYWIASNQYVSPYLSAYTAMAFTWLRRSDHDVPATVEARLHEYLLNLLRRDEFPTFYSKGMSSTVRAVALAALAESGKITRDDVERYARHVPEMSLFGKSHFLRAAVKTAGVDTSIIGGTIDTILGHASQSGGKIQFNEARDDSYKYLLATPLRANCATLSGLLDAQQESAEGAAIGDIPFKLVRAITQSRDNRDHWENTQENVFCMNALTDYAKIYERDDPDMSVSVSFDDTQLGRTSFEAKTDPSVTLSRPIKESDSGKSSILEITKEGAGRLYYCARIAYDLKEDAHARINSGIEIRREYAVERDGRFEILTSPMDIRRGELVRVDLFVSVPTARHFVAVNDPVPGGLEPVNTDLATASTVDAGKGAFEAADGSWFLQVSDWSHYGRYFWSFYHKELRHDSARFYADYLPAGNYHLSYTAQAIAAGIFSVMPVHVEEMYDPDVYGKGLPSSLRVAE